MVYYEWEILPCLGTDDVIFSRQVESIPDPGHIA